MLLKLGRIVGIAEWAGIGVAGMIVGTRQSFAQGKSIAIPKD
jgi:hypothetical protein